MKKLLLFTILLGAAIGLNAAQPTEGIGYRFMANVPYGDAAVNPSGKVQTRPLRMNVFLPESSAGETPAVILAFGGGFYRGTPEMTFERDGVQSTSMNDYCRIFAKKGYACFAIDYRLGGENPVAPTDGFDPETLDNQSILDAIPHSNQLRSGLGLNALDPKNAKDADELRGTILAAASDMAQAVDYITTHAKTYHIRPDRIILGGFSAGAITAWNTAYGFDKKVQGVVMISGDIRGFAPEKLLGKTKIPTLMLLGEKDSPARHHNHTRLANAYDQSGVDYTLIDVPAYGHFYPAGVAVTNDEGLRISVERAILDFMKQVLP